jgi:hypothetical protein
MTQDLMGITAVVKFHYLNQSATWAERPAALCVRYARLAVEITHHDAVRLSWLTAADARALF